MSETAVRLRRFTRREYDRLVEQGFFGPHDRIELLEGQLVVKEPQDSAQATAVLLVTGPPAMTVPPADRSSREPISPRTILPRTCSTAAPAVA